MMLSRDCRPYKKRGGTSWASSWVHKLLPMSLKPQEEEEEIGRKRAEQGVEKL
jgi:hypothetical protein